MRGGAAAHLHAAAALRGAAGDARGRAGGPGGLVGHLRGGLARVLLDGAVRLARESGARVVEGYPVDVSAKARTSSAELYHGPLSTFIAAGFREVARPRPPRPVVRLELAP